MIKVLIVDDEKYIRDELSYFLSKIEDLVICGEASTSDEAMALILEENPDLVFLDIQLRNESGVILGRKIMEIDNPPRIVFATAYDNYAVQGFDMGVVDYILKPFTFERIAKSIDRIRESSYDNSKIDTRQVNKSPNIDKFCIYENDKIVLIDLHDILYLEYSDNLIKLHTKNKIYTHSGISIKDFEQKYEEHNFIRTHKSYIVNIKHISEIVKWFNYTYKIKINHCENVEIPVSRNYIKKFKASIGM